MLANKKHVRNRVRIFWVNFQDKTAFQDASAQLKGCFH